MKVVTAVLLVLLAQNCSAFTWHVEQDGSGDYEIIQHAVDVAAVGDTILIGPGRYDQYWEFQPQINWWAVVGVETDSLTFIGTGRDEVIIGTDYEFPVYPDSYDSHGLAAGFGAPWLVVENITFENMKKGVRCIPGGEVRNCRFRFIADDAVFSENSISVCPECSFLVEDCEFIDSGRIQAVTALYNSNSTSTATIQRIHSSSGGGTYTSHPNVIIDECHIEDVIDGIMGMGGVIHASNSMLKRTKYNVYVGGGPEQIGIYCDNIRVEESRGYDMKIYGRVEAENCVFTGAGDSGVIRMINLSAAEFHNNHIFNNGSQYAVDVFYHQGSPFTAVHFENNWWGTADPDSVADMIFDHADTNATNTTVLFEPILLGPCANKKKSFGGMKQLFR